MSLDIESYPAFAFGKSSDTVVYAPYPWAGNITNSGRYGAIARRTGFDIIAAHSPGAGRTIIHQAMRQARKRFIAGDLGEMAAEHAQQLERVLGGYKTRIGMGDSGRGVWVAAMQRSGEPGRRPFTHVMIRDGVSLRAPESRLLGGLRVWRRAGGRGLTGPPVEEPQKQALPDRLFTGACGLSEMITHANLIGRQPAGVIALEDLAEQPDVPLHNITIGKRSVGGSTEQVLAFSVRLAGIREEAARGNLYAAHYLPTHEPTWGHGNLMDVDGAVRHLALTARMAVSRVGIT